MNTSQGRAVPDWKRALKLRIKPEERGQIEAGRDSLPAKLHSRQANDEPRAQHAVANANAVLGDDLAMQRLDNLPADR